MIKKHEQFNCPVCNTLIGPWSRGITFHALSHGLSLSELWLKVKNLTSPPTCQCSENCEKLTSWYSWDHGYMQYVAGHYDVNKKSVITSERLNKEHWSRGKTKETDKRLFDSGQKASKTRKRKYSEGIIQAWSKGKTKETHSSLARAASKMIGRKNHFFSTGLLLKTIQSKITDKFLLLTPLENIENRENNKSLLVEIECTNKLCGKITTLTIYNLIRKQNRHRCKHCDVPKRWISEGERELVAILKTMYSVVEHTVYVNGWSIDVYVPQINVYFQFDGIYWHGLDRPVSEITNKKILKKVERDKQQIEWFSKNSMNLVRINEIEWKDAVDKVNFLTKRMNEK